MPDCLFQKLIFWGGGEKIGLELESIGLELESIGLLGQIGLIGLLGGYWLGLAPSGRSALSGTPFESPE